MTDHERAYGYLSADGKSIVDFSGNIIGTARVTARWRRPRPSYVSTRLYQVNAVIDGRTYTGRCAGTLMLWSGRSSHV